MFKLLYQTFRPSRQGSADRECLALIDAHSSCLGFTILNIPHLSTLENYVQCVKKVPQKQMILLFSEEFFLSDTTVRRSAVDREDLKPNWKSEKRPHFSR